MNLPIPAEPYSTVPNDVFFALSQANLDEMEFSVMLNLITLSYSGPTSNDGLPQKLPVDEISVCKLVTNESRSRAHVETALKCLTERGVLLREDGGFVINDDLGGWYDKNCSGENVVQRGTRIFYEGSAAMQKLEGLRSALKSSGAS